MNDNFNVKKKIGTSIITVLIIAFGLFLVCGVRPPQPTFEDPSSGDEEFTSESGENEDGDLAEFLDDESGATSDEGLEGNDFNDGEFSESDEDLLASAESGSENEDDSGDILSLLDSEDSSGGDEDDLFAFDESESGEGDDSSLDFASVDEVTNSASSSEEGEQFEGAMTNESYDDMSKEADHLNSVLEEKTTEADSLKKVLENYDEKIAVMELENSGVGQQYSVPSAPAYVPPAPKNDSYAGESSYSYDDNASSRAITSETARPARKSSSQPKASKKGSNYDSALSDFNSGNYTSAARLFEEVLVNEPENNLADDCQYWLGECFLAMRDYTRAVLEYEKVFVFDDSDNDDDAQFKIGLTFLEAGNRNMARNELDTLLDFYSDSQLARKARSYLQRL